MLESYLYYYCEKEINELRRKGKNQADNSITNSAHALLGFRGINKGKNQFSSLGFHIIAHFILIF